MKTNKLVVAILVTASLGTLWGEEAAKSAETPSAAVTGESKGSAAPQAMTAPSDGGVFVTLTRGALGLADLPSSVDTVTPEKFSKFDAQTAGDAVSREASIMTLPIGRLGALTTARIRGSTSNQTLLLIDGRPVAGTSLGTQDMSEIPSEQIDHIEIVRGGVSALYGPNAMGGVINVITKRATFVGSPISHVGYESASYGRQIYRMDFGSRQGPVDYFFFGDQQWESGFRSNSDARTYNIGGNAGFSMGAAGKLLVDLSSYHANTGVPGQISPEIPTNQFNNEVEKLAATPAARQLTDTQYARTSYLLPLPMNSLMTLRMFGSQREANYTDPDNFVGSDRHENSKGGEAQFNLPLGFVVGGNFVHDREDSTDHITPTSTFIRSVENWGVFIEETFKYDRLTLIPSGRFDHNSQAGDSKNPRVQLIADATPTLRFSGSAARSFRAPTIDDLFYPLTNFGCFFGTCFSYQGNPSLLPETAWTYDAGFEYHPESFSFRATYFRANVSNLILTTTDPASTTSNVGTARRQGMEIQIAHVVNEYFRDTFNYTYLENRGIPIGFTSYVTLPNSPKHTLNYIATITPRKGWSVDSTARYVDSRYSGNNQTGTKLGSMVLWDMRLGYQWRQMELYLGVNDITNRRYEESAGFPLPGRTAYGGIKLRLWG